MCVYIGPEARAIVGWYPEGGTGTGTFVCLAPLRLPAPPPKPQRFWLRRGTRDRTAGRQDCTTCLLMLAPQATAGGLDPCGLPSVILFFPPAHTHTHKHTQHPVEWHGRAGTEVS